MRTRKNRHCAEEKERWEVCWRLYIPVIRKLSGVREGKADSEKEEATVGFYGGSESYTPKVHQTSLGLAAWHTG